MRLARRRRAAKHEQEATLLRKVWPSPFWLLLRKSLAALLPAAARLRRASAGPARRRRARPARPPVGRRGLEHEQEAEHEHAPRLAPFGLEHEQQTCSWVALQPKKLLCCAKSGLAPLGQTDLRSADGAWSTSKKASSGSCAPRQRSCQTFAYRRPELLLALLAVGEQGQHLLAEGEQPLAAKLPNFCVAKAKRG